MNHQRGWGEATRGSDARPVAQRPGTRLRRDAEARALRAFWRGMGLGALLVGAVFLTSAAFGETITIGNNSYINGAAQAGTTVTLEPSARPGELAVVTLDNAHVNDGADNGTYFLGIEGLVAEIEFTWDAVPMVGSDRILVIPPEGITCLPADCTATVMEGFTGTVVLLDWVGS